MDDADLIKIYKSDKTCIEMYIQFPSVRDMMNTKIARNPII